MCEGTHLEVLKRRRRRREVHAHREDCEQEHRGEERWHDVDANDPSLNSKLFSMLENGSTKSRWN